MKSLKKTMLAGLALGLIVSAVSVNQINAAVPAWKEWPIGFNKNTGIGLAIAVPTTVVLSIFFIRKPLKEPRFDKEKLLSGTWNEKLTHSWYFFSDKVIGWPYKDGKQKFKFRDGNVTSYIEPAQIPGGALGYFQAYVLHGAVKSLGWPIAAIDSLYKLNCIIDTFGAGTMHPYLAE